jgi:cytochrome c556
MIRRLLLAAVLAASTVSVVSATSNVIEEREGLFKAMGREARPVGAMLKGEAPLDLPKVQATLDLIIKNAQALPAMFPAGSQADSDALPTVWERNDEFKALFVKLGEEAAKAKVAITDDASLKANFPSVIRACGTCHQTFRKKS